MNQFAYNYLSSKSGFCQEKNPNMITIVNKFTIKQGYQKYKKYRYLVKFGSENSYEAYLYNFCLKVCQ